MRRTKHATHLWTWSQTLLALFVYDSCRASRCILLLCQYFRFTDNKKWMSAKLFFYGALIMMSILPSTDKHESKSAAPAVPASKITHFEDWASLSSLAESESISVAMQMILKATSPWLLSCSLNMFNALHYFFILFSTVCRLSALSDRKKKQKFLFMQGFKS